MLRIIVGVIAGFLVWSILWVGSDAILAAVSPDWYARHLTELDEAARNRTAYTANSTILVLALIRSLICSIAAGYVAALIAKENTKSTLGLGVLLLLFGIFIQSIYWNYVPLWYHIPFLLLLVPMTILGGNFKRQKLLV